MKCYNCCGLSLQIYQLSLNAHELYNYFGSKLPIKIGSNTILLLVNLNKEQRFDI